MEDTSAAYPHGSITGRSIVSVRFLITDIFLKSDRRTVCTWNFFRSEDGCRTDYDCIFKICRTFFILHISSGSIYRFVDIDGIHSFVVKEDSSYGIPFGRRNHDWYICSAITDFVVTCRCSDIVNLHGLVTGKFFRYELGKYKSSCSCSWNCGSVYIFTVKTNQCISAWRSICTEYGSEY